MNWEWEYMWQLDDPLEKWRDLFEVEESIFEEHILQEIDSYCSNEGFYQYVSNYHPQFRYLFFL